MRQAGTQHSGKDAERRADAFLQRQGLRTLARNYRCRGGEIDLIARDRDTLVFVEVRLRRHTAFGGPLASVDARKQRRLTIAAEHYLQRHPWSGPCRFDVIGIDATDRCEWVRDAFAAG
jgi:putative endonuclease